MCLVVDCESDCDNGRSMTKNIIVSGGHLDNQDVHSPPTPKCMYVCMYYVHMYAYEVNP